MGYEAVTMYNREHFAELLLGERNHVNGTFFKTDLDEAPKRGCLNQRIKKKIPGEHRWWRLHTEGCSFSVVRVTTDHGNFFCMRNNYDCTRSRRYAILIERTREFLFAPTEGDAFKTFLVLTCDEEDLPLFISLDVDRKAFNERLKSNG